MCFTQRNPYEPIPRWDKIRPPNGGEVVLIGIWTGRQLHMQYQIAVGYGPRGFQFGAIDKLVLGNPLQHLCVADLVLPFWKVVQIDQCLRKF